MKIKGCLWKRGVNGCGVCRIKLPYRERFAVACEVHDSMYDIGTDGQARRKADLSFLRMMLNSCDNTLHVFVAMLYYYNVRMFGWLFYRYRNIKNE